MMDAYAVLSLWSRVAFPWQLFSVALTTCSSECLASGKTQEKKETSLII